MPMLAGKVAIVTRSTDGIGLGIARALAAAGASVTLDGLGDAREVESLRAGMAAEFAVSVALSDGHMSRPDHVRSIVRRTIEQFGGIDILVNNVVMQRMAPLEGFPDDDWDAVVALNLSAVFHATKATLPQMRQRNWGRIINIACTHEPFGPHKAAYVAAKDGVLGLTKVAALETATTGITCNAICPQWVSTPVAESEQPAGDFATTEQIGALVVFLCSDQAAHIHGACLPLGGGLAQ